MDRMWFRFKSIIDYVVENYIPLKTFTPKRKTPWTTQHIIRITKQKSKMWKALKRNPSESLQRRYNAHCRYVKKEVKFARSQFERNKFMKRNIAPKSFYSHMDECTKNKPGVSSLSVDGVEVTSNHEKAQLLVRQFESIFTRDNDVYPPCPEVGPDVGISSVTITDNEIMQALRSMSSSNASGPDGISPALIRNIKCHMVLPLKMLFVESLNSGMIPSDWKSATIIPSYKNNGKPSEPASYRPISLTSIIAKLLERVI